MMEKKFQMSMMGELTFLLGIQVKQMKQGTFVHQAIYTKNLMKKFNMAELKPVSTLMSTTTSLDPDENGEAVDQREYRSMIGSLLYLTRHGRTVSSSCACVRVFRLPHVLHIGLSFNESLGISNILLSLRSDILLLLRWILLVFPMLILWVVGLTERALLLLVIFLNLLLFDGLLKKIPQFLNPPQRLSM
jgi:hypothetical protein